MNVVSSSKETKCVARMDTICSTRPLNSPRSTWASACSCTTNARLVGRDGWLVDGIVVCLLVVAPQYERSYERKLFGDSRISLRVVFVIVRIVKFARFTPAVWNIKPP